MKKAICLILVALLALSTLGLPALAGDQGELGRLTKLNVDEDTLTQEEWEAIAYEQTEEQGRISERNG